MYIVIQLWICHKIYDRAAVLVENDDVPSDIPGHIYI